MHLRFGGLIIGILRCISFTTATKKNKKNRNNMESLPLQVDGAYTQEGLYPGGGGVMTGIFFDIDSLIGLQPRRGGGVGGGGGWGGDYKRGGL